jgi:flagellar basal-body rod modification protein FlgD
MVSLAIPSGAAAVAASATAASTTANSGSSTTSSTNSVGSGSAASSLTQSDFLQLLTAQLKYQTPNNPADPTQLAQEFAAISTVDGIDKINTQLSSLQTSTGASQIGQASSLVGKQVAVAGNGLTVNQSGSATGAFTLAAPASDVAVAILNPNGTLAASLDLGAQSAGQQNFTWTGGTAGGTYSYQVSAVSAAGNAVSVTPYTVYTVQGVNVAGASPTLNVAGSATALPVSSVQTILGVP